ncbi:MAG: PQQ-binding-like beta-propeller repeat protein [bacterium]
MNRKFISVFSVVLLLSVFTFGCSSKNHNPVIPTEVNNTTAAQNADSIRGSGLMLCLFDIEIDKFSGEVEIVPIRSSEFEANITRFLQPPIKPTSLIAINFMPGTNFPEGHIVCDVSVHHPFPGTKFAGFDVRGIVMGESGPPCKWDPALIYPDNSSVRLLNPDGYTRWWNQTEFTSYGTLFGYTEGKLAVPGFVSQTTLNPYKYFCDQLGDQSPISEITPDGRGFFSSENPGMNTRLYDLQFPLDPTPKFRFKYAISGNWFKPNDDAVAPWTVDDFSLSANQAEAFRIEITDKNSTAYFENTTTYGGDLNLEILISDWQLLGYNYPYEQISGIYLESPTLFTGVINAFDLGDLIPEPFTVDATISVSIPDVTPSGLNGQILIVHVASVDPSDYKPQIVNPSGFEWPEDAHLAAHQIWEVPVSPESDIIPPVSDPSATNPTEGDAPLTVHLDPSNSYDLDGTIVLYEWDVENDGSFDLSTVVSDFTDYIYEDPGNYYVNLRVTDNDGLSDEADIPLEIVVNMPEPPIWSQLQDEKEHIGDIYWETELNPPLTLDWTAQLTNTSTLWSEGSPIIGGGYVMVMHSDNESNWAECFKLKDGEWAWKTDLSPGGKKSYIGTQTACYGDGRFYTPGTAVRALDPANGGVLWEYAPDAYETERHGLVFDGGKVYVHLSNMIHILDASDGSLLDTVTVSSGYANFQPFTLRDNIAYVQVWGAVSAYDLTTKIKLWTFNVDNIGGDLSVRGSPTVPGDGKVYFGCYNGYFYAVNQSSGGLVWKHPVHGGQKWTFDTAAYSDGRIYYGEGGSNTGDAPNFVCLDADTGGELWSYVKAGAVPLDMWYTSSPVVVNGIVYAGCYDGNFYGFDAVGGGVVFNFPAPDSVSTDPAVVDGRLLFLCDDWTLRCFKNE